jgi:hypothetical protein
MIKKIYLYFMKNTKLFLFLDEFQKYVSRIKKFYTNLFYNDFNIYIYISKIKKNLNK